MQLATKRLREAQLKNKEVFLISQKEEDDQVLSYVKTRATSITLWKLECWHEVHVL